MGSVAGDDVGDGPGGGVVVVGDQGVAASTESPIGFSTITGTPAATHSRPPVTCSWFGVARMTPSGLSRTNSSASDEYSRTENFAATSAAAGNGSTTAARVADGGWRRQPGGG